MRGAPGPAVPRFPHEDLRDGSGAITSAVVQGRLGGGFFHVHFVGVALSGVVARPWGGGERQGGCAMARGHSSTQLTMPPRAAAPKHPAAPSKRSQPWAGCVPPALGPPSRVKLGRQQAQSPATRCALAPARRLNSSRSRRGYGRKRVLAQSGLAPTPGFALPGSSPSTRSHGTIPATRRPKGRGRAALSCRSQRSLWPRQGRRGTPPGRGAGGDAAPRLRAREG